MTTTNPFPNPNVPLPAGAVHVDPWQDDDGDGQGPFRLFVSARWPGSPKAARLDI